MKRLLTGCAALLWAGAAAGQIVECVDAKGNKEYAQTCPPGTVKETRLMKSGGASSTGTGTAPAGKSLVERDTEFKKRSLERQEAEAKAAKEKTETQEADRNCNDALSQLRALQGGQRISRIDPNTGERTFLEDADRPAEIASAQKAVDSWCKKK
jgi:hypothetical protein